MPTSLVPTSPVRTDPSPIAAPPLVVIAGPTATGKTWLSLCLAGALPGAEIISADSRQVYRGMDIGTAKVSPAERGPVPHHGLDLVEPDEPFSVADFDRHAREVLAGIAARGGVALLAGGTGLYLRAVARGMPLGEVPSDATLRASVEEQLRRDGLTSLVARLRAVAPSRAAEIDLHNPRRVVRAVEIAELQGDEPLPLPRGYPGRVLWLGLRLEPSAHRAWIAARARSQFQAGLVEEAAALRQRYPDTLPSFSGIGYHEAFGVLDGRMTVEAAISEDARRNAQFARRQATWFRSEPGITWLDAAAQPLEAALPLVEEFLSGAAG